MQTPDPLDELLQRADANDGALDELLQRADANDGALRALADRPFDCDAIGPLIAALADALRTAAALEALALSAAALDLDTLAAGRVEES